MTEVFKGSTSQSRFIELVDSTTGAPKTGIVYTDVTGSYARTRSARTAITMATLASASASYSSGGFILVDDTNQPGIYRVDVPNAAFATGAEEVVVTIKATGCRTVSRGFTLVDWNKQVAAIPNVAAGAVGGLPLATDSVGGVDPADGSIEPSKVSSDFAPQIGGDILNLAAGDLINTNPNGVGNLIIATKTAVDALTTAVAAIPTTSGSGGTSGGNGFF